MNSKSNTISRRQVLRGVGGFIVALPFLESLAAPRNSRAEEAPPVRKRFACVMNFHGNLRPQTIEWDQPTPRTEQLFSGHTIRAGDLAPRYEGGRVVFSSALQAPSDVLTDRLLRKMNVYRAIDVPFFTDHTTGGPLGNFARSGDPSEFRGQDPRETIDSVLGWSNTFYSDLSGVRERVLLVGTRQWENELSWRHSSPASKTGNIEAVRAMTDPGQAWDTLFRGFEPGAAPEPPTGPRPIIDLVLEDYRRLRQTNARLSAADRQRLDDHVERLHELERKVDALREPPAAACGSLPPRVDLPCGNGGYCTGNPRSYMDVYTDIIATSFMCGLTRVAVLNQSQPFVANFSGDWHQDVAHTANQALLAENNRNIFTHAALSLASKLDVEEAGGRTFLDNSLVMFTNENGYDTHWSQGIPMVTFGSAGGFFRTGQLVDFRSDPTSVWRNSWDGGGHGITLNQWLAIVLQSMGLPRSEFEVGGQQGYGRMRVGTRYQGRYVPEAISQASRIPNLLRP